MKEKYHLITAVQACEMLGIKTHDRRRKLEQLKIPVLTTSEWQLFVPKAEVDKLLQARETKRENPSSEISTMLGEIKRVMSRIEHILDQVEKTNDGVAGLRRDVETQTVRMKEYVGIIELEARRVRTAAKEMLHMRAIESVATHED